MWKIVAVGYIATDGDPAGIALQAARLAADLREFMETRYPGAGAISLRLMESDRPNDHFEMDHMIETTKQTLRISMKRAEAGDHSSVITKLGKPVRR